MTVQPTPEIPSAWAAYGPILAGIVRAMLAAVGAAGFTWAQAITGSQIEMAVGAAMMFAAAMWSIFQKIAAAREARRLAASAAVVSAELSAERGVPTPVVPRDPGAVAMIPSKSIADGDSDG
jgi:hypothetical protein